MSATRQRTALVVGGTSGIGLATACALADQGFRTTIVGRTPGGVARARAQLGDRYGAIDALVCDVTRQVAVDALAATLAVSHDRIDVLVNSAGQAMLGDLDATHPNEFARLFDVNVVGPYRTIHALRTLISAPGGVVINLASRAGRQPYPNALAYGSSKAALVYLTRALSLALRDRGVRVLAVSPGAVGTPMRAGIFPDEDATRLMQPDDAGRLIAALASARDLEPLNGTVLDMPW